MAEELAKGMVVRHKTLGIGRIVALEATAVHVFFADGERQEAAKLRLSAARPFLSPEPDARDPRLDDLPKFALDPVSGRYAPERARPASKKARKK